MGYYANLAPFNSSIGAGTKTTNAGSSTVTVTAPSATLAGDLIVLIVYAEGDIVTARDAGEGWLLLDGGYDSTNNYGIAMFACVSCRAGATRAGLELPASMAWTANCVVFRLLIPTQAWDLPKKVGSGNWYNNIASSTAADRPAFQAAGQAVLAYQGLQISAAGYNNAGTTTTSATITNWSEAFDGGQTSPPHGLVINFMNVFNTINHNSIVSSVLALSKTKRAGVRAFIPFTTNNLMATHRTLSPKRLWT